jgi:Tol biopolymer transport system component
MVDCFDLDMTLGEIEILMMESEQEIKRLEDKLRVMNLAVKTLRGERRHQESLLEGYMLIKEVLSEDVSNAWATKKKTLPLKTLKTIQKSYQRCMERFREIEQRESQEDIVATSSLN